MNNQDKNIIKYALVNALYTVLYIILVGTFLSSLPRIFGSVEEPNMLIPIFMLMLFVFSAALTGSLVLGRPILWYLDGKKIEAIKLFGYTLGIFFAVAVVIFVLLYLTR